MADALLGEPNVVHNAPEMGFDLADDRLSASEGYI
jgi:hypothetical protein